MRKIMVAFVVTCTLWGCNDSAPSRAKPRRSIGLKAAQYEAEIAALKARLTTSKSREAKWPIINAHEHLLKPRHLPAYLAAARRIGVRRTVIVTSTRFTLFGKGDKTYDSMSKNFPDVMTVAKTHPGEIIPFATVDPRDPKKLAHLKEMVDAGALGVKLYTGHSNLYEKPLDDPSMFEIYQYLEETQLPINWHINLNKFDDEFENVMEKYPKLNVMVPHYGVAFWRYKRLGRLSELMKKYPNMIVDTSLGTREILLDGMAVMEREGPFDAFSKFFVEHQDQIIYGSDSVITGNLEKTPNWYYLVLAATLDHLEEDTFTFPLAEAYAKYFKKGKDPTGRIKGFGLPDPILKKIYVDNAVKWLEKYKPLPPLPKLPMRATPADPAQD